MKHLIICLMVCVLSPAYGMGEDITESLKTTYTLTKPIPEDRLWTDPPQDEKDYVISDPALCEEKPQVIPQNFTLKEERFVKYDYFWCENLFRIYPPKELKPYVVSLVFANECDDRRYYVQLTYNVREKSEHQARDEEISKEIAQTLQSIGLHHDIRQYVYCMPNHSFTLSHADAYYVGRVFHCFASLKLIPFSLVTHLMQKVKMPIQMNDFDLSMTLFNSKIEEQCKEIADVECGQPPSPKDWEKKWTYKNKKEEIYKKHFINFAIEALGKITNSRLRTTMAWGLSKKIPYEYEKDVTKLYDLLNEPSLPFYRDAQREKARLAFRTEEGNKSASRDETKLFSLIRTFLWLDESRDHAMAESIASFYLGNESCIKSKKLSVSQESILALLENLRSAISWCQRSKMFNAEKSLAEEIQSIENTEERENKLREILKTLNCEAKVELLRKLRCSDMTFPQDVHKIRVIELFNLDIDKNNIAATLKAISDTLKLNIREAQSDLIRYVKDYLEIPDSDKEFDNFSISKDTIFLLLKRIRKTHEERQENDRKSQGY